MAKGSEVFEFTIELFEALTLDIHAIFRFGEVESVTAWYNGIKLNLDGHLYDEEADFITYEQHLKNEAQDIYDTSEIEVIYIPKG